MLRGRKEDSGVRDDNRLGFVDFVALLLAMVQVLLPYILIGIAVFTFVTWFLIKFWLKQ